MLAEVIYSLHQNAYIEKLNNKMIQKGTTPITPSSLFVCEISLKKRFILEK
jgi:hypothetical protein